MPDQCTPLDLSTVVARIKAEPTDFRRAELSTERHIVQSLKSAVVPSAYVLRAQGQVSPGGPGNASGLIVQAMDVAFEVMFTAQRYGDNTGSRAVLTLAQMREQLWAALIGWTPDGAELPVFVDRYEDGDPGDSLVWGIDRFMTRIRIRKTEV